MTIGGGAATFTTVTSLPSATAADGKPTASEIGVTPTEVRIAVIADVDTPLAPGAYAGARDAVQGFAKYINKQGGLAGRKVVVDFYDSKLSGDETRNAIITAALFSFLFAWGDFLFALTLTTGDNVRPLTVGLYLYVGTYVNDWSAAGGTAEGVNRFTRLFPVSATYKLPELSAARPPGSRDPQSGHYFMMS